MQRLLLDWLAPLLVDDLDVSGESRSHASNQLLLLRLTGVKGLGSVLLRRRGREALLLRLLLLLLLELVHVGDSHAADHVYLLG